MTDNTRPRPPYLWALATFAVIFVLYLLTLSPTVAFWDAPEYITAAKVLGIPHPPGNPLFTLMAHVWGMLPLAEDYAKRINIFAAFCSAAGAGLWFLVAERWLHNILIARSQRIIAIQGDEKVKPTMRPQRVSLRRQVAVQSVPSAHCPW